MKNEWAKLDLTIGDADQDGKADVWISASLHGIMFEHKAEMDFDAALSFAQQTLQSIFNPKK